MSTPSSSSSYLVVGAGPSGLGLADVLSDRGPVILLDRIPVPGGTAGWSDPRVQTLADRLGKRGATLRLGQTALRWSGNELLVATPSGFERVPGAHLFIAGGLRPSTLADLGVDGDRPAGVLPATVAEHLLHAGQRLWSRVVILGDEPWAPAVAALCQKLGTHVVAVTLNGDWGDEQVTPSEAYTVRGRDRISALVCRTAQTVREIPCDALVLAANPLPNRNVEGALLEGTAGVTFHQPCAPWDFEHRLEAARRAARAWEHTTGGAS